MKVRHRSNGYKDWKVLEESDTFYIVESDYLTVALKKLEYEPVQEWVDVTHECTIQASALGAYCIYRLGNVVNPGNTAHRVTCKGSTFKIEVKK